MEQNTRQPFTETFNITRTSRQDSRHTTQQLTERCYSTAGASQFIQYTRDYIKLQIKCHIIHFHGNDFMKFES